MRNLRLNLIYLSFFVQYINPMPYTCTSMSSTDVAYDELNVNNISVFTVIPMLQCTYCAKHIFCFVHIVTFRLNKNHERKKHSLRLKSELC